MKTALACCGLLRLKICMQADHVDCELGLSEGQAFYDQECPQLTALMCLMLTDNKQEQKDPTKARTNN